MDCSSSQNYYVIILWWYFYKLFSILTIYIIAKVYLNWFTHTHAFTYTLLYTHLASSMSLWGSFLRQISKTPRGEDFFTISHLVFWFGLTNILHSRKNKIKADKFYYCPLIWHIICIFAIVSRGRRKCRAPVPLEMFDAPELEWIWP
jgi:hypothetical protein